VIGSISEPAGIGWLVAALVTASMRETLPGGPERCAIHLLPVASTQMPSGAVGSAIVPRDTPAASNSSTPLPPETHAWPALSNAMPYGEMPAVGVIVLNAVPSALSTVTPLAMYQILPSGATATSREAGGVAVCVTTPPGSIRLTPLAATQ